MRKLWVWFLVFLFLVNPVFGEIRYETSNKHTVNGLYSYAFNTTQSSSGKLVKINEYSGNVYVTQYLGIRVWVRHSDETETEITDGSCVAVASGSGFNYYSATWECPLTDLEQTDAILIKVYGDDSSPPNTFLEQFITEQLNAVKLNNTVWVAYYRLYRSYSWLQKKTTYYFAFGNDYYNSRIENFSLIFEEPEPSEVSEVVFIVPDGFLVAFGFFGFLCFVLVLVISKR